MDAAAAGGRDGATQRALSASSICHLDCRPTNIQLSAAEDGVMLGGEEPDRLLLSGGGGDDGGGGRPSELQKSQVFFARLTKFERLSTHLANERTWLVRWRRMLSDSHSPRRRRGCGRRCRS